MKRKATPGAFGAEISELAMQARASDVPKVFFTGSIAGLSDSVTKDLDFLYVSKYERFSGIANMKWQGTSSLNYPKKNFTIKLYTDSAKTTKLYKNFIGWGNQNKFCLKANYIDHSHSRNIVSARIWSEIVDLRESVPVGLKAAPNNGAIDGFPIKLYLNGVYQGLYTWNIPKDGWQFGMSLSNTNHAVLCAETHTGAGAFRAAAVIDGTDWSLEFPDILSSSILTSFNSAISHVRNTDNATFKASFSNYFDLEACIDYYLYAYYMCHLDGLGKNMLMVTYDGQHWIPSMYDMDSTWGLYYNGGSFVTTNYQCPGQYECSTSLLWERITYNYPDELRARYTELRTSALSVGNIINQFERFIDVISGELYAEDLDVYPEIPSGIINNIQQIRSYLNARTTYVDAQIGGESYYQNLLGHDGDCEVTTGWNPVESTIEIDSLNKYSGTNCLKIVSTQSHQAGISRDILPLLNVGKYYMLSGYCKNGNAGNGVYFGTAIVGDAGYIDSVTNITTTYTRLGLLIQPSDYDAAVSLEIRANVYASAVGQYGYVDNIMVNEISADDYISGVASCLAKYPYKNSNL